MKVLSQRGLPFKDNPSNTTLLVGGSDLTQSLSKDVGRRVRADAFALPRLNAYARSVQDRVIQRANTRAQRELPEGEGVDPTGLALRRQPFQCETVGQNRRGCPPNMSVGGSELMWSSSKD